MCRVCLAKNVVAWRPCCRYYICSACMATYVSGKVREGLVRNLQCPNCNRRLTDQEVLKSLQSESLRQKWRQFKVDAGSDPNLKTCPGCGQITDVSVLTASLQLNKDQITTTREKNQDHSTTRENNKDSSVTKAKGRGFPKPKRTELTRKENGTSSARTVSPRPVELREIERDWDSAENPSSTADSDRKTREQIKDERLKRETENPVLNDKHRDEKARETVKKERSCVLPVTCDACALKWCFACHAPWHEDVTCAEYLKGDKQFIQWTTEREANQDQRNAQQCPKCKVYIQRYRGCRKMVCRMCGTSFCYICGNGHCNQVKRFFLGSHSRIVTHRPGNDAKQRLIRGSYTGMRVAAGTTVVMVVGAAATALSPLLLSATGLFMLVRAVRKRRAHRRYMDHCRQRAEAEQRQTAMGAALQHDRARLHQLHPRAACA